MTVATKDPLLTIAKIVVWTLIVLLAIGGFAIAIAIPAVLFDIASIQAEIELNNAPSFTVGMIAPLLLAALVLLAMAIQFMRYLLQIIDTVGEGDPFVPANAERLTKMAWLMLIVQLLSIPAVGLSIFLADALDREAGSVADGVDASGLVLVLVLFILARVFRKGAEMRDDLEGTV